MNVKPVTCVERKGITRERKKVVPDHRVLDSQNTSDGQPRYW